MIKRIGLLLLAVTTSGVGACSEDEPSTLVPDGAAADGGAVQNDASRVPGLSPRVEVRAEPATLVRGRDVRVPIQILRRDTASVLTLRVQGAPAGVATSGETAIAADVAGTEVVLTASDAAAYGDFTVQLVVSGPDISETVVPLALQVRGVPGSLDTSFGVAGSAVRVPLGKIGDVIVDSQGRFVIGGRYTQDLPDDDMLMARLTPDGMLDTSFGTNGVLRWASPYDHYSHPELRPGGYRRGLLEKDGGYSLTTFLEYSVNGLVIHSEVSAAGAAPQILPPTKPADLGSVNGGWTVIREGTGFFRFETGCKISKHQVDGQRDLAWGASGSVEVVPSGGTCYFEGLMDTPTALHVLLNVGTGAGAAMKLATVERATGVLRAPAIAFSAAGLSRPNAAGRALAVGGQAYELDGQGVPTRFGPEILSAAPHGLGFYFADGHVGLIFHSAPPTVHQLSASGDLLGAEAGVVLEEPAFAQFGKFIDAYPDGRGRLVLVYAASSSETLGEHWTIKRFWL